MQSRLVKSIAVTPRMTGWLVQDPTMAQIQ
jgi:hypothetical protein